MLRSSDAAGNRTQSVNGNSIDRMDQFYQYTPLDHNQSSIRLLRVQKSDSAAGPISCSLVHTKLGDLQYRALSYTWGPKSATQQIKVNGKLLQVRRNLHGILRRVQTSENFLGTDYFWIDAICINQDARDERNHQVKLMKDIYQHASEVFICLGNARHKVLVIFQRWLKSRSLRSISYKNLDEVYNHIIFADYWWRLWIIQEVVLARSKSILLGDIYTTWENLWQFLFELHSHLSRSMVKGHCRAMSIFEMSSQVLDSPTPFKIEARLQLRDLLSTHWFAKCSDPRDRVYGLLSLVEVPPGFDVDYDESTLQLASRVLRFFKGPFYLLHLCDALNMSVATVLLSMVPQPIECSEYKDWIVCKTCDSSLQRSRIEHVILDGPDMALTSLRASVGARGDRGSFAVVFGGVVDPAARSWLRSFSRRAYDGDNCSTICFQQLAGRKHLLLEVLLTSEQISPLRRLKKEYGDDIEFLDAPRFSMATPSAGK